MKMGKISVSVGVVMLMVAGAAAAKNTKTSTDSTNVYFHGTITDTPCGLDPSSDNQTVEMGHIAAHLLANHGTSDVKPFTFKLTDCDTSTQKTVAVTFSGTKDSNDSSLLALGSGDASGAGIAIKSNGKEVTLDKATAPQELSDGDNILTFGAYLKGDSDGASSVTPGEFNAVSNVTFTYQ